MTRRIRVVLFYGVLTVVGLFMLLPFLWSLSTSLKPDDEIIALPIKWLPSSITFEHYWSAFTAVPFARHFANSMLLAVAGVVTNLLLGALAGYAFARRYLTRGLAFTGSGIQ